MKTGTKIKKLRELKGIPKKEMAGKLSLSGNGYGKIEREESEPSMSKLKIISQVLEIDIQLIIDFDVELFLTSYREMKKYIFLIEQLKKENSKLLALLKPII